MDVLGKSIVARKCAGVAVQVSPAMSSASVQEEIVQNPTPNEMKAALVEVTSPIISLYSSVLQDSVEV